MKARVLILLVSTAISASAQTNHVEATNQEREDAKLTSPSAGPETSRRIAIFQRVEQMRDACIQGRRLICGKILKVLPDGLVVDSGYTNLLRAPLTRSWLLPSTVTASRGGNLIEGNTPGSVCVGLAFLTDTPHKRHLKPKLYDYVIIEGYPAGQYTYKSVGTVHRTVRRFSAVLEKAVALRLEEEDRSQTPTIKAK